MYDGEHLDGPARAPIDYVGVLEIVSSRAGEFASDQEMQAAFDRYRHAADASG